jgi:hypothetical protein
LLNNSINVKNSFASKFLNEQHLYPSYAQKKEGLSAQKPSMEKQELRDDHSDDKEEKDNERNSITSVPNPPRMPLSDYEKEKDFSARPEHNSSFEVEHNDPEPIKSNDAQEVQQLREGSQLRTTQMPPHQFYAPMMDQEQEHQRLSFGSTAQPKNDAQNEAYTQQLIGEIQNLTNHNAMLAHNLQNLQMAYKISEQKILEYQKEVEQDRSMQQHKINYLLQTKQELETKCYQQQEMIRKYAEALDQMQRASHSEHEMLSSSTTTIHQHKLREEELIGQIGNLKGELLEMERQSREQNEEFQNVKQENENLQLDLKTLVSIEAALRNELNAIFQKSCAMEDYIQKANVKLVEDHQKLSEFYSENESLKQSFSQLQKSLEMQAMEIESKQEEVVMLKEELMKKYKDGNMSATSLADKENEIFRLKTELARVKTGGKVGEDRSNLDMLLKQNSDSFAREYLKGVEDNRDIIKKVRVDSIMSFQILSMQSVKEEF